MMSGQETGVQGAAPASPAAGNDIPPGKPKASRSRKRGAFARFAGFVRRDHRYVFLGTSAVAFVALWLWSLAPSSWSVLAAVPPIEWALAGLCVAWLFVAAAALVNKLLHWRTYAEQSVFVSPRAQRIERVGSYVVCAVALLFALDRLVLGFCDTVEATVALNKNPQDFVASAVYMIYNSRGIYLHGVEVTIELAIFGTIIAFVLAVLLVFLRIQTPDRSDNDFVRFCKSLGNGFARLYSTIIRGTPMMVQGLIIYYGIFGLLKGTGMSISEIQGVWSFFTAGLVTLSCCSAAYMAEVLRASIEAIDPGQTEAARSLGFSQWQAMRRVVFPQGIKNAIPAISNQFIINIKDSSVLSVIGVFDLMYATTSIAGIYFRQMELYVVAALTYLVLTLIASKLLDIASSKMGVDAQMPASVK